MAWRVFTEIAIPGASRCNMPGRTSESGLREKPTYPKRAKSACDTNHSELWESSRVGLRAEIKRRGVGVVIILPQNI